MAALEQVMQMKGEGKGEGEIIAVLRAQGVSPMEISDAINQSKIKEAVIDPNPTSGMTPSIMQSENGEASAPQEAPQQAPPQDLYAPQGNPQAPQSMEQAYQPQAQQESYAPQEQYYDQYAQPAQPAMNYGGGQDQYAGAGYDDGYDQGGAGYSGSTDAMIEVAEQVFAEKMKKLQKDLRGLTEFKTIFETKVQNLSHRLERMEKNFDRMQLDILGKVSEYGKGIDYVKKELKMVEDSFGKMNSKF